MVTVPMTNFAFITTIASLLLFGGWLALSMKHFGILGSYSSYASKWKQAVPLDHGTNLWSIITVVVAILLAPAMLEVGDESPLQFLGFFAPAYFIVAACTPEWETNKRQLIIHCIGASLCAAASVIWVLIVLRLWYLVIAGLILGAFAAFATKTYRECYVLWAELAMFAAVYAAVLI